jgi:hypothetical protein
LLVLLLIRFTVLLGGLGLPIGKVFLLALAIFVPGAFIASGLAFRGR